MADEPKKTDKKQAPQDSPTKVDQAVQEQAGKERAENEGYD